jgi:hypothetical protein
MDLAGLDKYLTKQDVTELIVNGKSNADNDDLWDITPEEHVDLAVESGAEYEELIEDHNERAIIVDISESAFDEEAFMRDHSREDGTPIEAFVASVGVYKKDAFDTVRKRGGTEREAALRVLGFALFNIGVSKYLTAEEEGSGEALPVVVLGNAD